MVSTRHTGQVYSHRPVYSHKQYCAGCVGKQVWASLVQNIACTCTLSSFNRRGRRFFVHLRTSTPWRWCRLQSSHLHRGIAVIRSRIKLACCSQV